MKRVSIRPENAHQARLLAPAARRRARAPAPSSATPSRSPGPSSPSSSTGSPTIGLVEPAGLAASRGGRRSHDRPARRDPAVRRHRHRRHLGRRRHHRRRAAGARRTSSEPARRPAGPGRRAGQRARPGRQAAGRRARAASIHGVGVGVPGPVSFTRRRAGRAADHAGLGPASRCATALSQHLGCPVWSTTT